MPRSQLEIVDASPAVTMFANIPKMFANILGKGDRLPGPGVWAGGVASVAGTRSHRPAPLPATARPGGQRGASAGRAATPVEEERRRGLHDEQRGLPALAALSERGYRQKWRKKRVIRDW